MHPYLIDFGELVLPLVGKVHIALPSYGALVATGLVIAWLWFLRNVRREGLPVDDCASVAFWTLIGGLAGGKLGLVLVDLGWYASQPRRLLSVELLTSAGVVWGALLAGLATLVFLSRRNGLPVGPLIDAAAVPLPLAQAIGRVGCLMAGCCYGGSCQLPWAIVYRSHEAHLRTGVPLEIPLHPAPLYEAAWSLAVVLPGLLLVRRYRRIAGETALCYLVLYGAGRFAVEMFRADRVRGMWLGENLSTSQIISLVVVPLALFLWIRVRSLAGRSAGEPSAASREARKSSTAP